MRSIYVVLTLLLLLSSFFVPGASAQDDFIGSFLEDDTDVKNKWVPADQAGAYDRTLRTAFKDTGVSNYESINNTSDIAKFLSLGHNFIIDSVFPEGVTGISADRDIKGLTSSPRFPQLHYIYSFNRQLIIDYSIVKGKYNGSIRNPSPNSSELKWNEETIENVLKFSKNPRTANIGERENDFDDLEYIIPSMRIYVEEREEVDELYTVEGIVSINWVKRHLFMTANGVNPDFLEYYLYQGDIGYRTYYDETHKWNRDDLRSNAGTAQFPVSLFPVRYTTEGNLLKNLGNKDYGSYLKTGGGETQTPTYWEKDPEELFAAYHTSIYSVDPSTRLLPNFEPDDLTNGNRPSIDRTEQFENSNNIQGDDTVQGRQNLERFDNVDSSTSSGSVDSSNRLRFDSREVPTSGRSLKRGRGQVYIGNEGKIRIYYDFIQTDPVDVSSHYDDDRVCGGVRVDGPEYTGITDITVSIGQNNIINSVNLTKEDVVENNKNIIESGSNYIVLNYSTDSQGVKTKNIIIDSTFKAVRNNVTAMVGNCDAEDPDPERQSIGDYKQTIDFETARTYEMLGELDYSVPVMIKRENAPDLVQIKINEPRQFSDGAPVWSRVSQDNITLATSQWHFVSGLDMAWWDVLPMRATEDENIIFPDDLDISVIRDATVRIKPVQNYAYPTHLPDYSRDNVRQISSKFNEQRFTLNGNCGINSYWCIQTDLMNEMERRLGYYKYPNDTNNVRITQRKRDYQPEQLPSYQEPRHFFVEYVNYNNKTNFTLENIVGQGETKKPDQVVNVEHGKMNVTKIDETNETITLDVKLMVDGESVNINDPGMTPYVRSPVENSTVKLSSLPANGVEISKDKLGGDPLFITAGLNANLSEIEDWEMYYTASPKTIQVGSLLGITGMLALVLLFLTLSTDFFYRKAQGRFRSKEEIKPLIKYENIIPDGLPGINKEAIFDESKSKGQKFRRFLIELAFKPFILAVVGVVLFFYEVITLLAPFTENNLGSAGAVVRIVGTITGLRIIFIIVRYVLLVVFLLIVLMLLWGILGMFGVEVEFVSESLNKLATEFTSI